MIGRQHSGLIASLLAFGLVACSGSPLGTQTGKDGKPGGGGTPLTPTASPFLELELPEQQDEPVAPPIQGLSWNVREIDSPRDQRIQQIHGALRPDGAYKFFLQQGEHFYHRTVAKEPQIPASWNLTQRLPSHRGLHPTRLFSDGEWLFFVSDDPTTTLDDVSLSIYQAKEGSTAWQRSSLPEGIVAVAGGSGLAFAATAQKLYRWNADTGAWEGPVVDFTNAGEFVLGLSLDTESPSRDLLILLEASQQPRYRLKTLPEGHSTYNSLQPTHLNITMEVGDRPLMVYRNFGRQSALRDPFYWGFSSKGRVYQGVGNSSLGILWEPKPFESGFAGLSMLSGAYYAYRTNSLKVPEILYLPGQGLPATWTMVEPRMWDGNQLSVTLAGEGRFAFDGHRIFVSGQEGLFHYPLASGKPMTYAPGSVGWRQESVELNRASVEQVIRCGSEFYARTAFGTYTLKPEGWVPFVLDKSPAMIFTSPYGHAATVAKGNAVDFYLFLDGKWTKVPSVLPGEAQPKATKVFFSRNSLFVAAGVLNGEAIYQRPLDATSGWTRAAPGQGPSSTYPTYISDGRVIFAVAFDKVRLASLAEQQWKDYSTQLILEDGSTQQMINPTFEVPFAVHGYAFAWIDLGGSEVRLCRATSKGWKQLVNNRFEEAEVGRLLSTDEHYLYSSTTVSGNTREIVRVPIQGGKGWERVSANFTFPLPEAKTVSLGQAKLKLNAPPFIDRTHAKVYLPSSRGILGN